MGMTSYIALLRGINVGGHKSIAMADLRDLVTRLGFLDARTVLQSGNLVFRSAARPAAQLEQLLETETARQFDLQTHFFVRTALEWQAIVARNPFRAEAARDPGHLLVLFLERAPAVANLKALEAAITGPETIRAEGREMYVVYPIGVGRSRLTNTLIEKKLGTRTTGRNWNTVLKLGALAKG